jgi:hypothetical protein
MVEPGGVFRRRRKLTEADAETRAGCHPFPERGAIFLAREYAKVAKSPSVFL